jgi:Ran GTPase-activating protein (RanGAP) involved in mRNA processing and transport
MQLMSSVMDLLTPVLKGKPIKGFGLNNIRHSGEGIAFAIEVIQSNQKLEEFAWTNSTIESMDGADRLVDAIISHPSIDKITLENCFGENVNAYDVLCSLLTSSKQFSHIDLETNSIRTGGHTEIPDFLATNPPLEVLLLANKHLDDNDATLIARALKRNTNLQRLRLDENDITDVGRDALRNAIFDSTSLNSLADSNHTCYIDGIDLAGTGLDNDDDNAK